LFVTVVVSTHAACNRLRMEHATSYKRKRKMVTGYIMCSKFVTGYEMECKFVTGYELEHATSYEMKELPLPFCFSKLEGLF